MTSCFAFRYLIAWHNTVQALYPPGMAIHQLSIDLLGTK
jgi:hypothetical protein